LNFLEAAAPANLLETTSPEAAINLRQADIYAQTVVSATPILIISAAGSNRALVNKKAAQRSGLKPVTGPSA